MKFDNLGVYGKADDLEAEVGFEIRFEEIGVVVVVLRAGGANQKYHRSVRKHLTQGFMRKVNNKQLSEEESDAVWRRVYAESVIIEVHGAKVDGKEMEFTTDNVIGLLEASPEMFGIIRAEADKLVNFRAAEVAEAAETLGNASSGKSSGGTSKTSSKR